MVALNSGFDGGKIRKGSKQKRVTSITNFQKNRAMWISLQEDDEASQKPGIQMIVLDIVITHV